MYIFRRQTLLYIVFISVLTISCLGQAAFLFALTSMLAPLIRMSYLRMAYMALPYTIILSASAFAMVYLLPTTTQAMVDAGWLDEV